MKLFPIHEETSSGELCPDPMDETVQSFFFPYLYVDGKGSVVVRVHELGSQEISHRIKVKLPLGIDPHEMIDEVVKPTSKAGVLVRDFLSNADTADRDHHGYLQRNLEIDLQEMIIEKQMNLRFGTMSPEEYFEWDDIEQDWCKMGLAVEEYVNRIVDDLGANGFGAYRHMVVSRDWFLAHVRDEIQNSGADE